MGLGWYRPVWAGQTVKNGAKDGLGPPPGVRRQLRWAGVWVYGGGGSPHTQDLLSVHVWMAWHGGKEVMVVWK